MALSFVVKFLGLRRWQRDNQKAVRNLRPAMVKNLRKASVLIRDQAIANVSGPGERTRARFGIEQGQRVRLADGGPITAPDDRLTQFEGRLAGSISYSVSVRGRMATAEIGPNVIYGRIHELGGFAGRGGQAYIPPRPYLQPAIDKHQERTFALLGQTFQVVK